MVEEQPENEIEQGDQDRDDATGNLYIIIKYARVPWFGSSIKHFAKKPSIIL
jgi:hypothetical protein